MPLQAVNTAAYRNQYLQPPRLKLRKLALATSLTLGTGMVFAQGLEEIIVTAQKRTESIQDTPISIAAMTSADLEKKGINEIGDLRSQVTSLQVLPHPTSAVTARLYMRGVGNADDQLTQDPSIAVYFDGVYVARSQGLTSEVADIERIEVLRGPQGSLYGRNATGGAINFISREPELGNFSFKQSLTFGNYDLFRSRTRLNVPLGDELAAEFSYLNMKRDGFIKNLGSGVDNFHDKDREALRVALLWQPLDNLSVRYAFDRSEVNDAPAYATRVPLYPEKLDRPSRGGSLQAQKVRPNDAVAQGHN